MTLKSTDRFARFPSIGIDAIDFDQYSHVDTADDELIVYDEENGDGWIQCDFWISVESME